MPTIAVVYENGVFRPLTPVELPNGAHGEVFVAAKPVAEMPEASTRTESAEPLVGAELVALLREIAELPYTAHPDGRTDIAENHDEILYPKEGEMP